MEKRVLTGKQLHIMMAALLIAIVTMALMVPTSAYAANLETASAKAMQTKAQPATKSTCAKEKTVKNYAFTTSTKTIKKNALKVAKGTSKLNFKGGKGYLKFTAPKTKSYSFTFSNLNSSNRGFTAFVEVQQKASSDPNYSLMTKASTKGGKSATLWLASNKYKGSTSITTVNRPLKTRTGTLKLKKGEDVYFYFYSGVTKAHTTLKIK